MHLPIITLVLSLFAQTLFSMTQSKKTIEALEMQAWENAFEGNKENALKRFTKAANKGSLNAAFFLKCSYETGELLTPKDENLAEGFKKRLEEIRPASNYNLSTYFLISLNQLKIHLKQHEEKKCQVGVPAYQHAFFMYEQQQLNNNNLVTLNANDGTSFKLPSTILDHSDMLKSMMQHDMQEKQNGLVAFKESSGKQIACLCNLLETCEAIKNQTKTIQDIEILFKEMSVDELSCCISLMDQYQITNDYLKAVAIADLLTNPDLLITVDKVSLENIFTFAHGIEHLIMAKLIEYAPYAQVLIANATKATTQSNANPNIYEYSPHTVNTLAFVKTDNKNSCDVIHRPTFLKKCTLMHADSFKDGCGYGERGCTISHITDYPYGDCVTIWDLQHTRALFSYKVDEYINMNFNHNYSLIIILSQSNYIYSMHIIDALSGKLLKQYTSPVKLSNVAFCDNNKSICLYGKKLNEAAHFLSLEPDEYIQLKHIVYILMLNELEKHSEAAIKPSRYFTDIHVSFSKNIKKFIVARYENVVRKLLILD